MKKNTYPAWALRYLTSNVSSIMRLLISSNIILIYYCVSFSIDLKCIFENIQKLWQIYDVACAAPAATAGALSCGNCFFAALLLLLPSLLLQLYMCWCERLLLMGSLLDWLLHNSQIHWHSSYVHAHTCTNQRTHTRRKKHTRCSCSSRRLGMDVYVCTVYVCSVFNESTTKNGRNVFCFYPSAVDVGFFGRWPLAHTHLQIPAHTHTRSRIHAHDRCSISFDICNFHFSVRAYHEESKQLICLALNVLPSNCCSIFSLRIYL